MKRFFHAFCWGIIHAILITIMLFTVLIIGLRVGALTTNMPVVMQTLTLIGTCSLAFVGLSIILLPILAITGDKTYN